MSDLQNKLVFSESPQVELGSNFFINVPVILQYKDTPLISVESAVDASFTTSIPIYHNDGTYLAKAKGTQLYLTEEGRKAGVTLRHEDKITVCLINGKEVFELRRQSAAALKAEAELYVPDGKLISYRGSSPKLFSTENNQLTIGGLVMSGSTFNGCKIGILLDENSIAIGVNQ
ncbi:hypothetical protein ACM2R8_005649 [Klebsiella pneumoniae]|uniref:hypothetical protein n=2 Tax=Klebsiella TaxID=570 RepID=UPI000D74D206|nr:hypothetical protein [Klebsiella pneumoniae]ELB4539890.1 hypothetical protein [Klebsiella pneumoniae]ELB5684013.1 hypothetical protein [Klebsiella pneumoniae]PXI84415.1 hypothetical protein DMR02_28710 [Klebsiella pneumoniae]